MEKKLFTEMLAKVLVTENPEVLLGTLNAAGIKYVDDNGELLPIYDVVHKMRVLG